MNTNTVDLIQQIVTIEWSQFSKVQNIGGPADCQSNISAFCAMRTIQASIWQDRTLISYLNDLKTADLNDHNLMTEKYAQMMATTHPTEYQRIKDHLPIITAEKQQILDRIMVTFTHWENDAINTVLNDNIASFQPETALVYLRNEFATYSMDTLALCLHDVQEALNTERNFVKEIFAKTLSYYQSLDASTNATQQQTASTQNSSHPLQTASCGTCGIDIPIGASTNLDQVAQALLNYDLPNFYDEER